MMVLCDVERGVVWGSGHGVVWWILNHLCLRVLVLIDLVLVSPCV